MEVFHAAVPAHLVQRLQARAAQADLAQGLAEQVGKRVAVLVRHTGQRGVETKAGVDADHEQVKRVRQALLDLVAPGVDLLLQPEHRQVVAEDDADRERDDKVDRVAQEQSEKQADRAQHRGCDEAHRDEVLGREVAGPSCQLEAVQDVLSRLLGGGARKQRPESLDRGPQHALAERTLELDLLHRQLLLSAVNGKSLLHHLRGVGGRSAREADEDHQHADRDDQAEEHCGSHR